MVDNTSHRQVGYGTSAALEARLEGIASPIRHPMRHLPAAMERIAPERQSALLDAVAGLTFNFTDEPRFVCRYVPSLNQIEFSAGAMTVMWVFSHAYVTLYDRVLPLWLNGDGELDLSADSAVREIGRAHV